MSSLDKLWVYSRMIVVAFSLPSHSSARYCALLEVEKRGPRAGEQKSNTYSSACWICMLPEIIKPSSGATLRYMYSTASLPVLLA
jgi:hypothetical protein